MKRKEITPLLVLHKYLEDPFAHYVTSNFQHINQNKNLTKRYLHVGLNTTPYHPQTDGLVERFNKTIIQMIKCFTQDYHLWCDQYLELCLFAYRISIQASTKFSPFKLLYGREPVIPMDIILKNDNIPEKFSKYDNFAKRVKSIINRTLALANNNIKAAQLGQENYYNTLKPIKIIKQGDQILLKNNKPAEEALSNNFLPTWIGYYLIKQLKFRYQ
ncbi:hypothetical protein RB653_003162 [Dictyostelium firmibasis]|uniref:Integrase catalytic domain-containing protein n=1 Tax=Dictyostelium firmibasis TaxID=79012 RepID=A0AAN7YNP2_9MYCE